MIIGMAIVILFLTQNGYKTVEAVEQSVYECDFLTINLDGRFGDWPADVHWNKVTYKMGWDNPYEGISHPLNDNDSSFKFACVADNECIYVAVKIWDDKKVIDEDIGDDVYRDDSIEIYIDSDNSKSSEYESDVSQITIGRYNVGNDSEHLKLNSWKGMNRRGIAANETGTMAAVVDTDYGWAVEAAIPFASFVIKPVKETIIGFNIQLNDDDDGGYIDHKLSWSDVEREGTNASYRNPSVFGELKLSSIKELKKLDTDSADNTDLRKMKITLKRRRI